MPPPFYLILLAPLLSQSIALSSHSPPDLLAHPKYSVSLADWNDAIANATASKLLRNWQNVSTAPQDQDMDHHAQESEKLGLSVLNVQEDQIVQEQPNVRHTLMRTSSGQAFLCTLPALPSPPPKPSPHSPSSFSSVDSPATNTTSPTNEADLQERKLERERIENEGLQNGLKLISALKDRCIYTRLGWFTYSFCYGKGEIRQFHALMIPGHSHPHEDPNQDVYVLGFHLDHPQNPHHQARLDGTLPGATATAAEGALTTLGRSRFAGAGPTMGISDVLREEARETPASEEEFGQKRYLVQRWDGGTICDMTGRPRAVEVQFHCSTVASDHIALLRETAICEYLLVIHTPRLCSEPLFLDGGATRKGIGAGDSVAEIACRPVLSDEEMDKWRASEEAKKRKKAEQEARQQKAIEDEQATAAAEKQAETVPQPDGQDGDAGHADPAPASAAQQEPVQSSTSAEPGAGAEPAAADRARTDETAEAAAEAKPAAAKPSSSGRVVDVDPITVYFDTDTGQIYMDEAERKAAGGAATEGRAQAEGQEGGARGQQQDEGYEHLEHITKALKESLGALLRDLRGAEEGERGARANGARGERAGSLAELVASLKESGSGPWKGRGAKAASGAGKPVGAPSGGAKAKVSEEHKQLMKMYGQKFEVGDEEEGDESKSKKGDGEEVKK